MNNTITNQTIKIKILICFILIAAMCSCDSKTKHQELENQGWQIKYDEEEDFSEGLAKMEKNGKIFYINKKGKVLFEYNNQKLE